MVQDLRQRGPDAFHFITVDIPVPLAALDRNTAEAQCSILRKAKERVPGLAQFEKRFDIQVRLAVIDRFAANLKGEQCLKTAGEALTVLPCNVHMQASALKKALDVVEDTVSGVLNTSLALQAPGALGTLRQILQCVFEEELVVVFDNPPSGVIAEHRRQVIDLFCSIEASDLCSYRAVARKRQLILNTFCNSDLTGTEIIHYCPYTCCNSREAAVDNFMRYVTWALLPKKMPILSRKSWTGVDGAVDWLGTLACFWNLASTLVLRYAGNPRPPPAPGRPSLEGAAGDAFVLPGLEHAEEAGELSGLLVGLLRGAGYAVDAAGEDCPDAAPGTNYTGEADAEDAEDADQQGADPGEPDWHAVNRQRRKQAVLFASLDSLPERLVLIRNLLKPAMSFLHASLLMASRDWELRQQRGCLLGHGRTFRIFEVATGSLLNRYISDILKSFWSRPAGLPQTSWHQRARGTLFRLLSAFVCSLENYLGRFQRCFPYCLFLLLSPDVRAEEIYGMPECLRDELATVFFRKFPTPEQGQSAEALALLEAWALLSETDIANIEAGHSSIRELTKQRARGHTPSLAEVSAKWLCRFVATHYDNVTSKSRKKSQRPKGEAADEGETQKKKRANPGHGGPWRAFLTERGRKVTKAREGSLKDEYAALSPEDMEYFKEQGLRMTVLGRLGYKKEKVDAARQECALALSDSTGSVLANTHGALGLAGEDFAQRMTTFQDVMRQERQRPVMWGNVGACGACSCRAVPTIDKRLNEQDSNLSNLSV